MDWMFWSIFWVVGALVSFTILLLGICRARVFADTSRSQQGNGPGQHAAGVTASAPLAEFGEELLVQKLARLHSQPSFYDRFIDGLGERFTFWQSRGLVSSWRRFFTNVTEAAGTQNDFVRSKAEQSVIPLEADKTKSTLRADIEEQKRRGAQAQHERLNLGKKPAAAKPEGERPVGDRVADARRWLQEEQERLRKAGVKEGEREWELLLNEYDQRIERLFQGTR